MYLCEAFCLCFLYKYVKIYSMGWEISVSGKTQFLEGHIQFIPTVFSIKSEITNGKSKKIITN